VDTDSVPGSLKAQATAEEIRTVPSPSPHEVGGGDAVLVDSANRLAADLPLIALIALLGTAALWSLLFRSAFAPLLALAAAIAPLAGLAVVQAIFGEGRLTDLLEYEPTGGIHLETYAVVGGALLAIGLARGAQLATALREERILGGGVAGSLARAGVLTASPAATASVLGIALAGVWLGSDLLPAQEIGLGLAAGLLADLVLVRLLIAPALARLAI
jgi:RND superfamily putative drug exporter